MGGSHLLAFNILCAFMLNCIFLSLHFVFLRKMLNFVV